MAFKPVQEDLNIIYSSLLDVAEAKAYFIQKDDRHFLRVEGKDNYDVTVKFTTKNQVSADPLVNSEIRIPIFGKDDLVVSYKTSITDPDNAASGVFNTSYDIGYGKGVYGPILVGPNFWNAWPSSTKNVSAYFFKGDKGKVYLRVNANSTSPQTVRIEFKQINEGASAKTITIPAAPVAPITLNPQPGNTVFTYGSSPGAEFTKTVEFKKISRFGNVFGPIQVDGAQLPKNDSITFEIINEGKEFAVLVGGDDDKDFNIRIDNVKIIQDLGGKVKYVGDGDDITDSPSLPKTIELFYGILDGGQEFAATDGSPPPKSDGPDFSLVVKSVDDDILSPLDVYHFGEEAGNNNRPVVIAIHAGAWKDDQTKDEFLGSKSRYFRKTGCILVNLEYRYSPEPPVNKSGKYLGYNKNRIKFPAPVEDIAKSIKWVQDNIAQYGGDPNKIVLYGHGSGAHLASVVATNKKYLNDVGVDPSVIKGCISSSTLAWNIKYELDNESTSLAADVKTLIYNAFGIDPVVGGPEANIDFESSGQAKDVYDAASPDLHLSSATPPFLILTRGDTDTVNRAVTFEEKLKTAGIGVTHFIYPESKTYSQTTIQSVLGNADPPSLNPLPKGVKKSVSQAINTFLIETVPFDFPTDAIVKYPEIDGQLYAAVESISPIPLPGGKLFGVTGPVGLGTTAIAPSKDSGATPADTGTSSAEASSDVKPKSIDLFGDPGIEAISVGYIDPVLGYVTGLSVCEANEKAKESPGTTFVAIDGDNSVNYLPINDINNLTADFTKSKDSCGGLKATVKCGEPILNIYGGGGVGAQANIIIGTDGSVMGVDVVHKGYGYQYPPLVQAIDKCYFGNGATFEAFLGTIDDKLESFDKEGDFEDYYVCPPGTSFGTLYDSEGKEIGKWDPSLYTNPGANPIAKQVVDYEILVNKIKKPWWTTRKKKPSKVTGKKDKSLTLFPVSHPCNVVSVGEVVDTPKPSVMDAKFIKKDGKIYLQTLGTGSGKIKFTMKVNDNPITAGVAAASVVIPSEGGTVTLSRTINPSSFGSSLGFPTKEIVKGSGNFKADETYGPIKIVGADKSAGEPQVSKSKLGLLDGDGKDENIKITFEIVQKPDSEPKPSTTKEETPGETWNDFMNKYAVSPVSPSNVPGTDFAATMFTMEWDELFPYDGEYIFRGCADGSVKDLYLDNEKITTLKSYNENFAEVKKEVKGGVHTIRIDLQNGGFTEKVALPTVVDFTIKGEANKNGSTLDNIFFTFTSEDGKDSFTFAAKKDGQDPIKKLSWSRKETVKIRPNVIYNVKAYENTKKYKGVEQGLYKTKKGDSQEIGEGTGNKIFADFLGSENDNDDIQIIAGDGEFKAFNKKKAKDGKRNTYDLTFLLKKKISIPSSPVTEKVFDTISFIDKADRKLWKINPGAGKDADFINKFGVSPFTTDKTKLTTAFSYAGVHDIRWASVNFPIDGEYTIDVAVDDNVKIYIGNKKSDGKIKDGSGLKSKTEGGDEEIIEVTGFSSPGVNKGKQTFTRKFKAGSYRIRAELEQIDVGALANGNPMILAIRIATKVGGVVEVLSKKSWCENPLGASVTIEAPEPPVPQEPAIVYEKCPPTPLWSTRQPKSEKIWYPVKYNGYKTFEEQISKVPKKEVTISAYQNVEFKISGEGSKGDKRLKYLQFHFESVDGKESFILKGVELAKDEKKSQYRTDKKVKKNLKYKVTARISDTKKAGFDKVEQGLGILKGKSIDEASKSKKSGTTIFADYIGSDNDNDDIAVTISKGDGEFTVGKKSTIDGRSTFELFYELESKSSPGTKKKVEVKPKFVKDKKDGKIYLDMTDYPTQEYELDFKFIMADTIKGDKGIAASDFSITGTSIKFSRYKNGKLIETGNVKKTFKLKGGKKYGPIVFSGGDKGSSTQIISADQVGAYDAKSTESFDAKTKKTTDKFDFNVILTDVSGVEFKEPKNISGWSKFMNRYAISPVKPLYTPGTDGGGIIYENSWDVEFPYDGFYKFEAQADNRAVVYVDGKEVLTNIVNFKETVSSDKIFVSKGKHKLKVEVENEKTETYDIVNQKVFSTKDKVNTPANKKIVPFTIKGNSQTKKGISVLDNIYFEFTSEDGKQTFTFPAVTEAQAKKNSGSSVETWEKVDDVFVPPTFTKTGPGIFGAGQDVAGPNASFHRYNEGTYYKGKKIKPNGDWNDTNPNTNYIKWDDETRLTLGKYYPDKGQRFGIAVWKKKTKTTSLPLGSFSRVEEIEIKPNVTYKVKAFENTKKYKGVEQGLFKSKKGDSLEIGEGTGTKIFADFLGSENDNDDIQIIVGEGNGEFKAFNKKKNKDGRNTFDLSYTFKSKEKPETGSKVTYSGPQLAYDFTHSGWSEFMNKYNVVPASKSPSSATYAMKWSGVEFPEDGQYEYKLQADNLVSFKVDGKEIDSTTVFNLAPEKKYFNASKGKHNIELILTNEPSVFSKVFNQNPTGVSLYITKDVNKGKNISKSWLENPMGVAVAISPPPCPKPVGGKGVIDKIIPTSPGTGYTSPTIISPTPTTPIVPVALTLDEVVINDPGINYNCGVDEITITPSNGAVLSYTCNSFGKITNIIVEQPGFGFTELPTVDIVSETGVNFKATPVFNIIRDPIPVDPTKVIQVTDLAGLKQTGWVDGRPYYGAIFYKDGLKFAGYYETIGEPVRIYDTQQESITGIVVTPPSAIERSGTDITSNDPRLDIPGTPRGLIQ